MATTSFSGFPKEAFAFFEGLAKHNDRAWFTARKDVYERACREPMKQLVAELGVDPARARILRISRDLRFSRDKSPYRTYIAAGVRGRYISLSPEGLYVGAGVYQPEPPALERYRRAADAAKSGARLSRIVGALRKKGYKVDSHEWLKGAPRGYAADHPRLELLRMKGIFAGKAFAPAAWMSTPKALARVEQVIKDTSPLVDWLHDHVGPAH